MELESNKEKPVNATHNNVTQSLSGEQEQSPKVHWNLIQPIGVVPPGQMRSQTHDPGNYN